MDGKVKTDWAAWKPGALGEAVGLNRSELLDETHLLPAVVAVNAYVNFARRASWKRLPAHR